MLTVSFLKPLEMCLMKLILVFSIFSKFIWTLSGMWNFDKFKWFIPCLLSVTFCFLTEKMKRNPCELVHGTFMDRQIFWSTLKMIGKEANILMFFARNIYRDKGFHIKKELFSHIRNLSAVKKVCNLVQKDKFFSMSANFPSRQTNININFWVVGEGSTLWFFGQEFSIGDPKTLSFFHSMFSCNSFARYVFRSPGICFWGTKYDVYCERVGYLNSILWRRTRLWLELFASTVGGFLSRVSYLPS